MSNLIPSHTTIHAWQRASSEEQKWEKFIEGATARPVDTNVLGLEPWEATDYEYLSPADEDDTWSSGDTRRDLRDILVHQVKQAAQLRTLEMIVDLHLPRDFEGFTSIEWYTRNRLVHAITEEIPPVIQETQEDADWIIAAIEAPHEEIVERLHTRFENLVMELVRIVAGDNASEEQRRDAILSLYSRELISKGEAIRWGGFDPGEFYEVLRDFRGNRKSVRN